MKIGVIGGSGLYSLRDSADSREISLSTPFGSPSDRIVHASFGQTEVFFIARHGRTHSFSPSEVPYRANIFALKSLGVEWCIAFSAVGSLEEGIAPGDMVIPDQIIDRTRQRQSTFFEDGIVAHVGFADPYCPVLSSVLLDACTRVGAKEKFNSHNGGTYICMEGPAFSTRAESRMYRSWGARVIGMTNLPEAKLAREAEIAYATVALVTDYDCWRSDTAAVEAHSVFEVLKRNSEHAAHVLKEAIGLLQGKQPSETASSALKSALVQRPAELPEAVLQRLRPLVEKYI